MHKLIHTHIALLIFLTALSIKAQQKINIDFNNFSKTDIGNHIYILEDQSGNYNIDNILSDSLQNKFRLWESGEPNFGFTSSVYWIRFTINNPADENINTYLEVSYPLIDYIDIYILDDSGNYKIKRTGDHLPVSSRDINHRNFIFGIMLKADSDQTYFMRFKTSSSMNLPLTLWSEKALFNKIEIEQILLGIFFGAVIIMMVYNIFLFVGFRDKSFVYLFLFIISWGFAQATINGLSFQYLWSKWSWWSDVNLPFFIFSALVTAILFCRSLLNSKVNFPVWDKILQFEIYFFSVGILFSLIASYAISIQIASGSAIAAILSVTATGLMGIKQKNRSAIIFISAWGFFLLGAVLFAVKSFGVIPSNFITNWSIQIGFFAMMVLLSIAVQDRIETEKKEKQKAQDDRIEALKLSERILEQKAEERTQEINRINIMLMDRAIELSSVNQISEKVNSSLNLSEVLQFACEELVKIFSVQRATIFLLNTDSTKLQVAAQFDQSESENNFKEYDITLSDNNAFKLVVESKQPLAIHNSKNDPDIISLTNSFISHDIKSVLFIPIISLKKVLGIIVLSVSSEEHTFTKDDIDLARTISLQVATSVENAKQFSETEYALDIAERDLEIGKQIQSGFFPASVPQIPGWEIAAYFKPARQVAGDFYDVFSLNNSNLTVFLIADVCDKGVGAALFMVLFRSLLRAYSEKILTKDNIEENLKSIIRNTNNYIANTHSSSNMFASIFMGVIDNSRPEIFYINAGHDSPFIVDNDGNIINQLDPTGPVVGMFSDMTFEVKSTFLDPGNILFAFTDGTIDAVNSNNAFFGEDALKKILTSVSSSAFSLLFDVNSALKKHTENSNQFDDITQIVIRRKISENEKIHSISREAKIEYLEELRDFVEKAAINIGIIDEVIFELKLAAEEVCSNIINYGQVDNKNGKIIITIELSMNKVLLKISDNGKHFPPDEADIPNINAPLEARKTGGLGLYFIKELMDDVKYIRTKNNYNLLILEKSIN